MSAPLALATPVAINSGNPRYPFPQFLKYGSGLDSLADTNPAGVPHAEQELWIRDAWQIFANEFTYPGTTVGGVQYIKANNGCPYDCTEGDGYALLAAAYMADKTTFDGIWMRFHDLRLNYRPRYQDGVVPNAAYLYGNNPKDNTDSAADGDFDAALAIVMAYYQWGANSGITISGGGTMNYQAEAIYAVDALVAKYRHFPPADCRVTTGDIGFDGYIKSGNTWGEMSNWANGMCPDGPEFGGPTNQYVDYAAPAYFNCFASFLQSNGYAAGSWDVTQLLKATASSDWLMGQHIGSAATAIPFVGHAQMAGTTATFGNVGQAEDFRFGWRTILNYIWNGNPSSTWNPASHAVGAGANTYEQAAGTRFAAFLANPQGAPWNNGCQTYGGAPGLTFKGPATLNWSYTMNGVGAGSFNLNWLLGAGSPAAVASQNFSLMAKLFRQCTIEWDVSTAGDGYLTSVPVYFHGMFRWLGMDILTGNHPDPCDLVAPGGTPQANMKIYKSVDRTYAFTGDTITYWLNYRNYASAAANNVVVSDALPPELGFISSVPAASAAPAVGSSGTVTWNRGTVTGFVTGGLNATLGGITLVAKVLGTTGRFCNVATISTSNGTGWTSNEYPNEVSAVMRRNCVDIVPAVMSLTQTAAPATACPGDKVTFTVNLKDNPGNWLNGGRPNVVVSFGYDTGGNPANNSNQLVMKYRLMHAADEPYIDYGNYRISYFLNDAVNLPGSWGLQNTIYEGGLASGVVVTQQALPPGPTWNQRMIVQFAPQLAAPAIHLFNYTGLGGVRIHKGGTYTLRAVWQLHNSAWSNVNWTDDWSYDPAATGADGSYYYPITNDWTQGDGTSIPVTRWDTEGCDVAPHTVTNILVEEWDGYTWRRAFGNGPVAGRQLSNVHLTTTLPACMTLGGFLTAPVGMTPSAAGQTLNWDMAQMQINEADTVTYWVTMGSCGGPASNTITMSATNENPISSTASIGLGAACGGTPTDTPSRTPTATQTRTSTASATPSGTSSPTASASSTGTRTNTPSGTPTGTPTGTPSATASGTRSATPSASATASPTNTAPATFTSTSTRTATPTPSATPSASPSRTPTPSVTATPTASITTLNTSTDTSTSTPTPSITLTPTLSASPTPSRTVTPTFTQTITTLNTATFTSTATLSASPSATRTVTATLTRTPSATPSVTLTWTAVPPGSTLTDTLTISATSTATGTFTATVTASATPSVTLTRTATPTPSSTPSLSSTRSASPSFSPSGTPSATPTWTQSATLVPTRTPTASFSASPSLTASATPAPPVIAPGGVSPGNGPVGGGNTVIITGGIFDPGAVVIVDGGVLGTVYIDPTHVKVVMPPHAPGVVDVQVKNSDGQSSNTGHYTYGAFTPTVTLVPDFYQQPELIKEKGVYPNPFSDRTHLFFYLRVAADVSLAIYNVAGEPIFTKTFSCSVGPNEVVWEGLNEVAAKCASGVYLVRASAVGIDQSTGSFWTTVVIVR